MAGRAVRRAAAAAALAAVLTACGSGSGGAPAASPSASADPTVLATPTDRSPHGVLLSAQLAVHGARRARFSGNLGSDTVAGLLFWAPKTVLQLKRPGTTEEVVVLDTTAYRGGDAATASRLGGRHWEKFTGVPGTDGQRAVPYADTVDRLNPVVALTAAVAAPRPSGSARRRSTTPPWCTTGSPPRSPTTPRRRPSFRPPGGPPCAPRWATAG
ncbi:hypothetical protein ACFQ1I_19845 [Kitasatospora arboriphila]